MSTEPAGDMAGEFVAVDVDLAAEPESGDGPAQARDAFCAFYAEHVRDVLGLVIAVHRDLESSKEITQEAFERAWQRWDRVVRLDRPGAWVRRVALNLARSRYRRLRSEIAVVARMRRRRSAADPVPVDTPVDGSIWDEVRRLPRRQAQVVALTYVDDLDSNGVAEVLGIDAATVRTHLTRARRSLGQRLEEPR